MCTTTTIIKTAIMIAVFVQCILARDLYFVARSFVDAGVPGYENVAMWDDVNNWIDSNFTSADGLPSADDDVYISESPILRSCATTIVFCGNSINVRSITMGHQGLGFSLVFSKDSFSETILMDFQSELRLMAVTVTSDLILVNSSNSVVSGSGVVDCPETYISGSINMFDDSEVVGSESPSSGIYGTLTFSGDLYLIGGATVYFDLSQNVSDVLVVTGNLTVSSEISFNLVASAPNSTDFFDWDINFITAGLVVSNGASAPSLIVPGSTWKTRSLFSSCASFSTNKCPEGEPGQVCDGGGSNSPALCSSSSDSNGYSVIAGSSCVCPAGYSGTRCQIVTCSDEQPVCSGAGTCTSRFPDFPGCTCNPGYGGATCNLIYCPNECSNHGVSCSINELGLPPSCNCQDNWTGISCDIGICPGGCSSHGTCDTTGDAPICDCDQGWGGDDCASVSSQCRCSGHGANPCTDNTTVCSCDKGWRGNLCNIPICSGVGNCSGHGNCTQDLTCQCDEGFSGADCSVLSCLNDCSNVGTCVLNQADFKPACSCPIERTGTDCSGYTAFFKLQQQQVQAKQNYTVMVAVVTCVCAAVVAIAIIAGISFRKHLQIYAQRWHEIPRSSVEISALDQSQTL